MSDANIDLVRRSYELFAASGEFVVQSAAPDFVWDMSKFAGWLEQPLYEGPDEASRFLREWTEPWDEWTLQVDSLRDAGDRVVAVMRQQGRSKATGMRVDMSFAQVWTIADGKMTRMEMYADAAEALHAVGLDVSGLD